MTVWWGTPVEICSALARLERETKLDEAEHADARTRLSAARRRWFEILPSDSLRELAQELPSRHAIRSADAFQLAAALIWCDGRPRRRRFVCLDDRLCVAAVAEGFSVVAPR